MRSGELFNFLKQAVEVGASRALMDSGAMPSSINKSQAYRLYGRSNIDRWILEGVLEPLSDQSHKILFDKALLEAIAQASNRSTYLPVAER